MKNDSDIMIGFEAPDPEKLKEEFENETCYAFEFDDSEEEDNGLERLETMLIGKCAENTDDPLGRMSKLVELFNNCVFQPEWSLIHYVPNCGAVSPFKFGRLPTQPFTKEDIPCLLVEEIGRITGIRVQPNEMRISWNVRVNMDVEDYSDVREYFLDGGLLGCGYSPKTRIPGKRWRMSTSQTSHEISAVFQCIKMFKERYLTVEERLVRWGLVMCISPKIQEFKKGYSKNPIEWSRILAVLDVREEDIQTMLDFTTKMSSFNPVRDLIPIRVLEVVTVFRVLFRLSLKQFESAYDCLDSTE